MGACACDQGDAFEDNESKEQYGRGGAVQPGEQYSRGAAVEPRGCASHNPLLPPTSTSTKYGESPTWVSVVEAWCSVRTKTMRRPACTGCERWGGRRGGGAAVESGSVGGGGESAVSRDIRRGRPQQSEAIRGNQRQSEAVRGSQRQSEAIRGNQRHPNGGARACSSARCVPSPKSERRTAKLPSSSGLRGGAARREPPALEAATETALEAAELPAPERTATTSNGEPPEPSPPPGGLEATTRLPKRSQAVMMSACLPPGGHQVVIRWPSDGHQVVIRWSSGGHQVVIRW